MINYKKERREISSVLTSNPTWELVSSCNPRYCKALIPLSTAVTANPKNRTQNEFAEKQK